MKVKGLVGKIFLVSPNAGICSGPELGSLKKGNVVDLEKGKAEQLLSMGMVEVVKGGKSQNRKVNKGDK
tara:strand:- start:3440 stop:3646 length:207 start_codon:yes stop_codon:yes gene_type:complete